MAAIFYDGFDHYVTADVTKMWTSSSGTVLQVGPSFARAPSGQGCSVQTGGAGQALLKNFGATYTQGVIGFAFYIPTATGAASKVLLTVSDGGSEQISVRTNASAVLTVGKAGTPFAAGTGTTVISVNTWYYGELKYTIHNTTGLFGLHLNGAVEVATTAANQNTRTTANNQWNGLYFGNNGGSQAAFYIDDTYTLDTSTGQNTDYLGPIRVWTGYAATPGTHTDFTPNGGTNVGNISEPYEDGDTSFNQSSTANQIDSFNFAQLPASTGSIFSVADLVVARQDSGAQRTFSPMQRRSGDTVSATVFSTSTSWQMFMDIHDQDPENGPGAWTVSNFNATERGEKLIS